ncbi:ABC transporter ATP-binding protein [Paraburkholderia sp. A3RO-2L]|uniref:ABC transporter ATP-binding protein n=1 Tax=Paraburkholderia sp. A3RO-2L TaxID=3028376 RepID=UPI003DA86E06
MSSEIIISAKNIGKYYQIYHKPRDRLKQLVIPRIRRALRVGQKSYYSEFRALNGISFDIKRGETVGIVGRNGSGKSTLLQIICGTLNPSSGELATRGRIAALLELGSGFNPEFTGQENVYMNGALLGLSRKEIDARYEDIIRFADIGEFLDQPVKTYSSGMTVRLAFAVAINADPEILIVDEALAVGDELFQRKCFARIAAIKEKGATILFVSHAGGTVIELCDRAILLDSGEQLAIGTPKKIVEQYQKLLYAPSDMRAQIRSAILAGDRIDLGGALNIADARRASRDNGAQRIAGAALDDEGDEESFDPSLVPASTMEYESQGALIRDASIRTLDGRAVNNLFRGRTYRYCYTVSFSAHVTNIRFGMMVKTISGVELGGGVSASGYQHALSYVGPGATYEVEFTFTCSLNPGVYFLNAGVVGNVDETETYLHRLIDIATFRVSNVPNSLATGTVDFQIVPDAKQIEGNYGDGNER